MCHPHICLHKSRQGTSSSPHGCLVSAPPHFLFLLLLHHHLMTSPTSSNFFFLRHLQQYLLDLLSSSNMASTTTSSSTSSSISTSSNSRVTLLAITLLLSTLLLTFLLLLLGLSRQQPNASSRSHRHTETPAAPLHTMVPFFLAAGSTVEKERAARSVLKGTLEHYRGELGVRMQAISSMVNEQLPTWEKETAAGVHVRVGESGNKERRDLSELVTKKLQERIWKDMEGLPAFWEANADLLWQLLRLPGPVCALPDSHTHEQESVTGGTHAKEDPQEDTTPTPTSTYNDGVQVLTHLYRDWSADGQELRDKTYDPILKAVARLFPHSSPATKILVPGAGLGRLAFELAYGKEERGGGHSVTALDISPVMIAATASVLGVVLSSSFSSGEKTEGEESGTGAEFYPFLHDPLLNQRSHTLRFYAARFPDAAALQLIERRREEEARKRDRHRERRRRHREEEEAPPSNTGTSTSTTTSPPPSPSPSSPSLSLELGNFIHLASQPSWQHTQDAVVTCYFIDTGPNILSYLWSIHSLLKPNGYWINLGPLNYHQTLQQGSVQLTLDEVEEAAAAMGFMKIEPLSSAERIESCPYRPQPPVSSSSLSSSSSGFLRVDYYQPVFGVYRKGG